MYFIVRVGSGLTDNYHSGGSAIVVADSKDEAIGIVRSARNEYAIKEHPEMEDVEAYEWDGRPHIFSNAGCC